MHELVYVTSDGEEVDLQTAAATSGQSLDVRYGEWDYDVGRHGAVSGVERASAERELELTFRDLDAATRALLAFERDMEAEVPGTLVALGEWSQRALFPLSKPDALDAGSVTLKSTVLLLDGVWRRETRVTLQPGSGGSEEAGGTDYPHDYPLDLGATASGTTITVGGQGALVRVTFFGAASDPYVVIGSNTYGIECSLGSGERAVIDPLRRREVGGSVYSVGRFGEVTNLFASRLRGAEGSGTYCFERLPAGELRVAWPQSMGVWLDIIEERGALPWS